MAERLTYDYYKQVADNIYEQQVEMPSAAKTHKAIDYGSLATHQIYFHRWREERKKKPVSLRERHKNAVIEKAIEFAEKLMKEHGNEIKSFKEEADAKVKDITEQLKAAHQDRQLALSELEQANIKLVNLENDHRGLADKFSQLEKEHSAIQEARKALIHQLEEAKNNHQQQVTLLNQQHAKTESYLQSQISEFRREIEHLNKQRQALEQNHAAEKIRYEEQLSISNKEKQEFEKRCIQLEQKVAQQESTNHATSKEKNQLQAKYDEINQENKKLITWKHEQIVKEASLLADLRQLNEQLKEVKSVIVGQQEEIKKNAVEIGRLQQMIKEGTTE